MPVERSESVTAGQAAGSRGRGWRRLAVAARDGSEDALGQIVTELSPMLWQVARAAGLASGDAEDVVQTVWVRLLSHLGDLHTPDRAHRLARHHHAAGGLAGPAARPQAACPPTRTG